MRCLSDPHSRQGFGQSRLSWLGSSQLWQAPGPRFEGAVGTSAFRPPGTGRAAFAVPRAPPTRLAFAGRELSLIPPRTAQRTAILAQVPTVSLPAAAGGNAISADINSKSTRAGWYFALWHLKRTSNQVSPTCVTHELRVGHPCDQCVPLEALNGAPRPALAETLKERFKCLNRIRHVAQLKPRPRAGRRERDTKCLYRNSWSDNARGGSGGGGEASKGVFKCAEHRVLPLNARHHLAEFTRVPKQLHDHAQEAIERAARIENANSRGRALLATLLLTHNTSKRDSLLMCQLRREWRKGICRGGPATIADLNRERLQRTMPPVHSVPTLALQVHHEAKPLHFFYHLIRIVVCIVAN
eukprot:scaffold9503_cov27-Tisochrysis_lutea.AAC.3